MRYISLIPLLFSITIFAQRIPSDTTFVNLKDYSQSFIYDIKYATEDNFLKANVYGCGECLLRYSTIKALIAANDHFAKKGLRIKIYDCYRPVSVQQKMWKIVPNPVYVANPSKGSIHNRGGAVDITLVDSVGNELDMGTAFDHFGVEAAHNYRKLPSSVLRNRKLLKKIMVKSGFVPFKSEWWHYNLRGASTFGLSNERWKCD